MRRQFGEITMRLKLWVRHTRIALNLGKFSPIRNYHCQGMEKMAKWAKQDYLGRIDFLDHFATFPLEPMFSDARRDRESRVSCKSCNTYSYWLATGPVGHNDAGTRYTFFKGCSLLNITCLCVDLQYEEHEHAGRGHYHFVPLPDSSCHLWCSEILRFLTLQNTR